MGKSHKVALWKRLCDAVRADLEQMTDSQKRTHEGATHAEARAEHAKDTRALEQTYLARGLASRVAELQAGLVMLEAYELGVFSEETPIAITALVDLEDDDGAQRQFLIAPFGGGRKLGETRVVTAESPIGRALLSRKCGDDVVVRGPAGQRDYEIIAVQ